jgi:cytoskeletal protein CcmA (bactofilin family)
MFKKRPSKNANIETLIGARTRIAGNVEFAGGLHVDGHILGNLTGEPGESSIVSVSEAGCIEGSVIAASVYLNGLVKGDIEASGRVELGAQARVLGNVQYQVIETAVGAQINGKLIHRGATQGPPIAAQSAPPGEPGRGPERG